MIGLCFENFVMESGSGGNGKDVLSNLYNSALTATYFYKGSTSTLLDMKIKSGGNPEVANMHKKRFVVFCEPPSSSTLNMGVLKDITGGGTINARQLYSKNCETRLENITSFICNERPNVGGDIGDAEMRRFINIPYTQVYSTNEDKIKRGAKQANLYYKTKEFQDKYKCHLINYLLTFDYIEPYIPKCISSETEQYLFDADNTSSYFADKIQWTDDELDIVSLRDLTNLYKEQFSQGSKDYRTMTTKKMMDMLKRNVIWKEKVSTCFHERYQNKKEKIDKQSVFTHLKLVDAEEEVSNI
jgi:putative DNA primase/helicase